MTENTNEQTNVTFTQAKLAELREDLAALQAKIAKLEAQEANEGAVAALTKGDTVSFEYGRGEKKRIMTGVIVGEGNDPKLGRQFAVQVGEGLDVQAVKIRAADVIFGAADDVAE